MSAVPLAGGDGGTSVLSTLARAGGDNKLLRLLSAADATRFRGVCAEARDAVAAYPWEEEMRVRGSLRAWRSCFPRATRVDISGRRDLVDADFVHLAGMRRVNMSGCNQETITDGAFVWADHGRCVCAPGGHPHARHARV